MKTQRNRVGPPSVIDKSLVDYSKTIDGNFETLFTDSHSHDIITEEPASNYGYIGQILAVNLSTGYKLWMKVAKDTWISFTPDV
jgi:hypothetical protein